MLFSDELGVKKAAEQLGCIYYTIADRRKARSQKVKEERIASDKTVTKLKCWQLLLVEIHKILSQDTENET